MPFLDQGPVVCSLVRCHETQLAFFVEALYDVVYPSRTRICSGLFVLTLGSSRLKLSNIIVVSKVSISSFC